MEGGGRSSGVLKKKSSSGCLIIKKKKKIEGRESGGAFNDRKGRKRDRLAAASFSDSSDEEESLEFMRRRANDKRLNDKHEKGDDRIENGSETKRSRLDLFDFDEYDEFDGNKMRRSEHFGSMGKGKEFGVSSSDRNNLLVGKCKKGSSSYFDSSSGGKSKGLEHGKKGLELEEDEAHMPISFLRLKYKQKGDQAIRLQGKNGVLKVMVNEKKKTDFASHPSGDVERRKNSRSDDDVKKDLSAQSPVYPSTKPPENCGQSVDDKEKRAREKERKMVKVKPDLDKENNASDSELDRNDAVLKPARPGNQSGGSMKVMKRKEEQSANPENITPVKGKDTKAKRGGGGSTEKQKLREHIKGMLIEAGWTIDYRPRRNRDYLDAVYINPNGTAYWSIIKAYDAFKKQLEEDNSDREVDLASPSLAPLSEDLVNKLTRQTKRKIGEGLKKNRKEDSGIKTADYDSDDDLPKRRSGKPRNEIPYSVSKSSVIKGRTSRVTGRCTLLVRRSDKGENSDSDGYVPYRGKRTVLAWLIDSGVAKLSEKVQYMNRRRTQAMLEGWLTRDGIHCGCCSKILPVSKFELHAGSKLRQPFQNIFLESGSSLLHCQIDAWNSQEESRRQDFHFVDVNVDVDGDDPDDDTCGVCGDGGDLVCCDSCPSTFHQLCLEIQMLPSGDWHCPNCTCKFCGSAGGNDTIGNELNRCSFCEKKYHKSCCETVDTPSVGSNGAPFCGLKCQELYDHLQKILGVKHELEAGFSWSLIQRTDVSDSSHRGFAQRVECNSKLVVASSVMDECFLPIIDRRSGINIIHNVVYNCRSNFNRLNYRGFYTVILERGEEIVAAAALRLHGTCLAEMPFIGTREMYRRQGMCRRLLSVIENELSSLKVEKLVIPAISEHINTWTTVFGFHELKAAAKKEMKSLNMLVFPGTDMLQKQLLGKENSGMKVSELTNDFKKSEVDSPCEQTGQASSDSGGCHLSKSNDEVDATDNGQTADSVVVHESDELPDIQGTCAVGPDVENKQERSSTHLKCSPHAESNLGSDIKHQRIDHPAKVMSDPSAEANVGNQSKTEAPCLDLVNDPSGESVNAGATLESSKPVSVEVNAGSSMNVSEDTCPLKNMTNASIKSPLPGSVSEISAQNTADKVESLCASSLETVVNKEPLERSD